MAKVRVYQADISAPCKFMDYDFTMKHGGIERKYYKTVFSGELPVSNLEAIYMLLNTSRPEGFTGHSLSVSDIVVVNDITYFVNSFGFKEIENF
jgi:hypothetical protein